MIEIRFVSDVGEWIQRFEAYAREASPLPDIDYAFQVHVHFRSLSLGSENTMNSLRSHFEQYLLSAPNYWIARFVVLCLYYDLLQDASSLNETEDPEETAAIRLQRIDDLRYFMDLPPDVADFDAPKQLVWELRQAWISRHWSRARRICDRLAECPDESLGDPRPSFAYMVWHREVHGRANILSGQRLRPDPLDVLMSGLGSGTLAHAPEAGLPLVRQALTDLENAFDQNPDVHIAFRAVQCDLLTACGRFEEAADEARRFGMLALAYSSEAIAEAFKGTEFEVDWQSSQNTDSASLAKFIGECLAAAGRTPEAIEQIEEAARRCPERKGLHRRLAELYAQDNRFVEAARQLALEREIDPDGDAWKDPLTNIASTIYREIETLKMTRDRQKEGYEKASDSVKEAIRQTITAHWPVFRGLHQESQRRWVNGCFWLFGDHRQQDWPVEDRFRYAVVDLAVAVECQLYTQLFEPFKKQEGQQLAATKQTCADKRLSEFVLFLKGDYRLNLGHMLAALRLAVDGAQEPLTATFHRYLSERLGKNLRTLQSDKWKSIAQARNKELHPPSSGAPSAVEVLYQCREFLNVIDSAIRPGAAARLAAHRR